MVLRELVNQLEKVYDVHGDNVPVVFVTKDGMKVREVKDVTVIKTGRKAFCILK